MNDDESIEPMIMLVLDANFTKLALAVYSRTIYQQYWGRDWGERIGARSSLPNYSRAHLFRRTIKRNLISGYDIEKASLLMKSSTVYYCVQSLLIIIVPMTFSATQGSETFISLIILL